MAPARKLLNFRIEPELLAELERIRDEAGVTVSEQIRRSLEQWVAAYNRRGPAVKKTARKRVQPRKQA